MTKTITVKSVTQHARQRVAERLGQPIEQAPNYLRQLMETAEYRSQRVNEHGNLCYLYEHPKSGAYIVISEHGTIITCYKDGNEIDPIAVKVDPLATIPAEILTVIRRKAGALLRKYAKETRTLDRQIAELELKIAQLNVNKVRVHNPNTKRSITESMELLRSMVATLDGKRAEVTEKKRGVEAHV